MKIHNIIQNNLKLIKDDVMAAMRVKTASYEDKELYAKENRREVLYLYRHMLKNIPIMFDRKLERVNNYEKIKFYFREGSREDDVESIKLLKNTAYTIIEKINKGVYPPFPKFKA